MYEWVATSTPPRSPIRTRHITRSRRRGQCAWSMRLQLRFRRWHGRRSPTVRRARIPGRGHGSLLRGWGRLPLRLCRASGLLDGGELRGSPSYNVMPMIMPALSQTRAQPTQCGGGGGSWGYAPRGDLAADTMWARPGAAPTRTARRLRLCAVPRLPLAAPGAGYRRCWPSAAPQTAAGSPRPAPRNQHTLGLQFFTKLI